MARGEAFVTCPHCGSQSRIPVMALQRNNYHCSLCGSPVPLATVNMPGNDGNRQPSRSRSKRPFQKHKRH
jgi:DNA-directed RNA polymerase subunit RPC12/RpoP